MTEAFKLIALARYLAHNAVREHLRNRGIRLMEVDTAELRRATEALLEVRKAELITQAQAMLRRDPRKACQRS